MAKGYAVKIEDGKGNEKKFFSSKAKSHEQGNALASSLIEHLSARSQHQMCVFLRPLHLLLLENRLLIKRPIPHGSFR